MREVLIPVHPLSLRVLQSEYGQGFIVMSNHDPLFTLLTCSPLRCQMQHASERFSEQATFLVNDSLALHMQINDWQIGAALFKFHKMELCKFATAAVLFGFKGGAKAALYVWLKENGVGEDDYALDTAYKLWQRFGWKKCAEKNTTFLEQTRVKSANLLFEKKLHKLQKAKPLQKKALKFTSEQIELISMTFSHSLLMRFRRPSKKLASSARLYYYARYSGLTYSQISQKIGIPRTTIFCAEKSIARQAKLNITLRRLIQEALPHVAHPPAPSKHDSSASRTGKSLHPDTRIAQTARTDRSTRSCVAA